MLRSWQDIYDDLLGLWRHAPLTGQKITDNTRNLVPLLSRDEDPEYVVARLAGLILQLDDIEEVCALAAVLGFDPGIQQATVPGRLAEFAVRHLDGASGAEDVSTPRRRARKGAEIVAKRLYQELMGDAGRRQMEVRVWGTPAQLFCAVQAESFRDKDPIQFRLHSRYWRDWQEVERASFWDGRKQMPDGWDEDAPEHTEGQVHTLESSCSMLPFGQVSIEIDLFEAPQPYVDLVTFLEFPCRTFAYSTNVGFSVVFEIPREHLRSFS